MVQPLYKTEWQFLKTIKVELLYNPVIPLPGIWSKEVRAASWGDTRRNMFIATLFTITENGGKPKVY